MARDKVKTLQDIALSLSGRGEAPALYEFRKGDVKVWSFAELDNSSKRLAAGLHKAGLTPGSQAILFAPNRAEWVITCTALFRAGVVPVPIDAQMAAEEFGAVIEQSGAGWIFTSTSLAERIQRIQGTKKGQSHELVLFDAGDNDPRAWKRFLTDDEFEPPSVDPEDRAVLFYTSGTSGKPKGVPLTHRNVASNLSALLELKLIRQSDRVLLPLPLHHVYPFAIGMLAPLALGVSIVLPFLLTGPQFQRALRESRATAVIGVPRLYDAFYAAIENNIRQRSRLFLGVIHGALKLVVIARRYLGINLGKLLFASLRRQIAPDLRILASGGAAMDTELAWKLEALGWELVSGYGLTETSPILAFNAPGQGRLGTAGKPLPGVDIKIDRPENNAQHGEVLAKGPNVFAGYLGAKEENEVFTSEGYFRTGDLGFFDEKNYLHLVGRASSMIVLSEGENIWPEKIEQALEQSEWIREAGVFAKDDRLAAVLVTEAAGGKDRGNKKGEELTGDEIARRLQTLPSHHRIAEYGTTSDPLPRTRIGKIRRHKLPEIFEQAKSNQQPSKEERRPLKISELSPEDQTLLQDPSARNTWEWLVERFADARMAPESMLQRDLGIDSMDWLNLTLEIRERASVDLGDEAIGRIETVRDLLREVVEATPARDPEKASRWLERPEELLSAGQRKWLRPPGPLGKSLGNAILGINSLFMRYAYRLEVWGAENLPANRPFIIAPNHTSLLDPLAVGAALPRTQLRHTYWGGWTGIMFKNPFMRLLSRALRVVPVDPERGPLSALAFGITALRADNNLVWFPEGGRSKDGKLQPFRSGVGILLSTESVPAVPVHINGTFEALPLGRSRPRFGKITVTFGRPFHLDRSADPRASEHDHQKIADALHDRVESLAQAFH